MMNDQTSPTAGGQRPEPPRRDPFATPPDARGLPPIPEPVADRGQGVPGDAAGHGSVPVNGAQGAAPQGNVPVWGAAASGFPPPVIPARERPSMREWLRLARPDIEVGAVLAGLGVVLGLLGGMAWYRFAPTVWMSIPAD